MNREDVPRKAVSTIARRNRRNFGVYIEFFDHGCCVSDWVEDFDTEQDAARFADELSEFIKSAFHSEA